MPGGVRSIAFIVLTPVGVACSLLVDTKRLELDPQRKQRYGCRVDVKLDGVESPTCGVFEKGTFSSCP